MPILIVLYHLHACESWSAGDAHTCRYKCDLIFHLFIIQHVVKLIRAALQELITHIAVLCLVCCIGNDCYMA